jgi:hypothetical protein
MDWADQQYENLLNQMDARFKEVDCTHERIDKDVRQLRNFIMLIVFGAVFLTIVLSSLVLFLHGG